MSQPLVFAGASNVLNVNLPNGTIGFSEKIATSLGLQLVKLATVGASNDFLLRSVYNYIQTETPKLLIVTWQTWEREEWEYLGEYYQINASGDDVLPDALQTQYKQWVIKYNPDNNKTLGKQLHEKIWTLHQELIKKGIPHVFYNEMYPFVHSKDQQKDWGKSFIGPYNNDLSFYWYLINVANIKPDDAWYHFGPAGHCAWADFLINYIKKNKIL